MKQIFLYGSKGAGKSVLFASLFDFIENSKNHSFDPINGGDAYDPRIAQARNSLRGGMFPNSSNENEKIRFDRRFEFINCKGEELWSKKTNNVTNRLPNLKLFDKYVGHPNKTIAWTINPYHWDEQIAGDAFCQLISWIQRVRKLGFSDAFNQAAWMLFQKNGLEELCCKNDVDVKARKFLKLFLRDPKKASNLNSNLQSSESKKTEEANTSGQPNEDDKSRESSQQNLAEKCECGNEPIEIFFKYDRRNKKNPVVTNPIHNADEATIQTHHVQSRIRPDDTLDDSFKESLFLLAAGWIQDSCSERLNLLSPAIKKLDNVILIFTHLDLRSEVSTIQKDDIQRMAEELFGTKEFHPSQIIAEEAIYFKLTKDETEEDCRHVLKLHQHPGRTCVQSFESLFPTSSLLERIKGSMFFLSALALLLVLTAAVFSRVTFFWVSITGLATWALAFFSGMLVNAEHLKRFGIFRKQWSKLKILMSYSGFVAIGLFLVFGLLYSLSPDNETDSLVQVLDDYVKEGKLLTDEEVKDLNAKLIGNSIQLRSESFVDIRNKWDFYIAEVAKLKLAIDQATRAIEKAKTSQVAAYDKEILKNEISQPDKDNAIQKKDSLLLSCKNTLSELKKLESSWTSGDAASLSENITTKKFGPDENEDAKIAYKNLQEVLNQLKLIETRKDGIRDAIDRFRKIK